MLTIEAEKEISPLKEPFGFRAAAELKRKRALVLKRDSYRCVYCGARATQVHHKQYAPRNIGREPIEWLVSVCKPCHEQQHQHK